MTIFRGDNPEEMSKMSYEDLLLLLFTKWITQVCKGHAFLGKMRLKLAPFNSVESSMKSNPPCKLTIDFVIDKPSPMCLPVVSPAFNVVNGSTIFHAHALELPDHHHRHK